MYKLWNFFVGLVIGAVISAITAFSHSDRQMISGHIVRYGFFLAMLLIVFAQLWIGRFTGSRLTTLGFALAWIATTIYFGAGNAQNSMAIPDGNWSIAYVTVGSLLVTMVTSVPVLKNRH